MHGSPQKIRTPHIDQLICPQLLYVGGASTQGGREPPPAPD